VAEARHVSIPAGFKVTLSGAITVPEGTVLEGPGVLHLTSRSAGLRLGNRCVVRNLTITSSKNFSHGKAISVTSPKIGGRRKADCRISRCRFEKMWGTGIYAREVSHLTVEGNYWENHSNKSKFYNAMVFAAVERSRIVGNTILHANQGVLFHGGRHNVIRGNYIENCMQGISCHTSGSHPRHWPYTLFTHNVISGNVLNRIREEGIAYDNSMGKTPAKDAAQNQVRAVAGVKAVRSLSGNRIRVLLKEPANPGKKYGNNWAEGYYVGILTGKTAGMLLEVIASGVEEGTGYLELPRISQKLPERIGMGDRLWIGAGCFYNTISGNTLDVAGMVSGKGNATCIGLWGAAWNNQIQGNICTTRQYGITLGCVALGKADSPQGPSVGNSIIGNTIAGSWRKSSTVFEPRSVAAIGFVFIGDGPLLEGRMFLGNRIVLNTISWAGKRSLRFGHDWGTQVASNRLSDEDAAIYLEGSRNMILQNNRTAIGNLVTKVHESGKCTWKSRQSP